MQRYCRHCRQNVKVVRDHILQRDICLLCGISLEEAAELPSGTIISGFQIEKKLFHDHTGAVYIAKQLNLQRRVKLKVLADSVCGDHDFLEQFLSGARAVAALNHPSILQTYESGVTPEGIFFLVYEAVEGIPLPEYIGENGRLDSRDALGISLSIAGALKYAWDKRAVCHGGIVPENVIVTSRGNAKLAGLFSVHETGKTESSDFFLAPEVLAGADPAYRSDMYSLGALLFLMATGFPHKKGKSIGEACRDSGIDISGAMVALIENLLAENPSGRPSQWRNVIHRLEKLLAAEHTRKPDEMMYVYKRPLRVRLSDPMALVVCSLIVVMLGLALLNVFYWKSLRGKTYYPAIKEDQMQYHYKSHTRPPKGGAGEKRPAANTGH